MAVCVYVSLLLPLLVVPMAGFLASRLHPQHASWLITGCALVLAMASTLSLAVLALAGMSRLPAVARIGQWSPTRPHHLGVVDMEMLAAVVLAALLLALAGTAASRVRAMRDAHRTARELRSNSPFAVLDDVAPLAHAIPGRPGKIVLSTAMLDVLDPAGRRAVLAHERAHLEYSHYLFTVAVDLASAVNPLLLPLRGTVRYTIERWADEYAAERLNDRVGVARAISTAALATRRLRSPRLALALGAGPVPRRVAALLHPAPIRPLPASLRSTAGAVAIALSVCVAVSALSATEALNDLHRVLEIAELP
jgi:hypothetical protein